MNNVLKNEYSMKEQVRKYNIANEIFVKLINGKYTSKVWRELELCRKKIDNIEPVYFDFNENKVCKASNRDKKIPIKSKGREAFFREQSGEFLEFLIRNPDKRELNWLFYFLFSTVKQRKGGKIIDAKDAKAKFVSLISNTMNSINKAGIPIFEYDSKLHKQGSEVWKIKDGSKMYLSNIQESKIDCEQAKEDFDNNQFENAFNNANSALKNDKRNVDACLLIIKIFLIDEFKTDVVQMKLDSLKRSIIHTLEEEIKRYGYFMEKADYYKRTNNEDPFDIYIFLLELINKLAVIKYELDKLKKDIDKKQFEVSGKRFNKNTDIQELIKKRDEILDKEEINNQKIIDLFSEPIISNILREIALSLSEWEKESSDLEDTILDLRNSLFFEYNNKTLDLNNISADLVLTKEYVKNIIFNNEFFKKQKQKHFKPKVLKKEAKVKSRVAQTKAEIQKNKHRDDDRD